MVIGAWMVLLGNNGIINQWLKALGLTTEPVPMLYNEYGVLIGMSYVLLPFMVPPLMWAVLATARLLADRPLSDITGWLKMLAAYDIVFVGLALLLFPTTVNE